MTVSELEQELFQLPPDSEVSICFSCSTGEHVSLQSAHVNHYNGEVSIEAAEFDVEEIK